MGFRMSRVYSFSEKMRDEDDSATHAAIDIQLSGQSDLRELVLRFLQGFSRLSQAVL